MARVQRKFTGGDEDPARIPDELVTVACLLQDLEAPGLVKELEGRLKIRRQGGYPGVDIWIAIFVYLAAGPLKQGLRPFWERKVHRHAEKLAALAGRKKMASSSSVSRALDDVETALLREASLWMLTVAPGVDELLRHPAVFAYDAFGNDWHVFDYDPTAEAIRHRALPVDESLPDPIRRSEDTGAPGYHGRKRGDIQYRRVDMRHAGAGVWVHSHLHRGNGDGVVELELAANDLVALMQRLMHPLCRTLMRLDGEHGYVPEYTVLREAGIPFITGVNRPKLYEDPDVLERMRTATWYEVTDSLSGPRRYAADIGVVTLHPDKKTRRPDGSKYEPVSVRVVASAYRTDATKAQRGCLLDGYQVELFAVDAPGDVWPAPDAVALFFGRAGQENRFAQEDREAALGRIVSYHLPGQEFACLVGLFLMNYRIARGFEQEPPPAVRPPPRLRVRRAAEGMPEGWPGDPVVTKLLSKLDWPALLAHKEGWTWDAAKCELRCHDGRPVTVTSVRPVEHAKGRTSLIFRRPTGGCEDCDARDGCLRSERPAASKHLELSAPTEVAAPLRARLAVTRGKAKPKRPVEMTPIAADPGIHAMITPRFLPAAARRRFAEIFRDATMKVHMELPPPAPLRPRLVCADEAERQARRLSWARRNTWNALPDEAVVGVDVYGGADLGRFLGLDGARASTGYPAPPTAPGSNCDGTQRR